MRGKDKTFSSAIHIGQFIQEQLKHDGLSVTWLAQQISCTRNHMYKVFQKQNIDCELLLRISKAMRFDFFKYYSSEVALSNAEWMETRNAKTDELTDSGDSHSLIV